jgi:hypothetical protein
MTAFLTDGKRDYRDAILSDPLPVDPQSKVYA